MAGNQNSGGHNRKPTQMHVIAGTFRKDRHGETESPDPPIGVPQPPKKLTGEAKAEWDRMITRLTTSKTISIVDDGALYQYCRLFAETEAVAQDYTDTRELSNALKKAVTKLDGAELVAAIGEIVKLRQLLAKQTTQSRQQRMAIRQYLVEFGLTPSSRGRVKITNKKKPDATGQTNKQRFFGGAPA